MECGSDGLRIIEIPNDPEGHTRLYGYDVYKETDPVYGEKSMTGPFAIVEMNESDPTCTASIFLESVVRRKDPAAACSRCSRMLLPGDDYLLAYGADRKLRGILCTECGHGRIVDEVPGNLGFDEGSSIRWDSSEG